MDLAFIEWAIPNKQIELLYFQPWLDLPEIISRVFFACK